MLKNNYEVIGPSVFKFSNTIDSEEWINVIEKTSRISYPFHSVDRRPHLTMELPTLFNQYDDIDAIRLRSMFLELALPAITSYMEINKIARMFPKKSFITVSKLAAGKSMTPHRDNFDKTSNHFICMMYINDNFSGGELNLIDINLKYKPVSGDIIIYKGNIEHEVLESDSLRYSIGYGLTDRL